jgi:hypothetical protein
MSMTQPAAGRGVLPTGASVPVLLGNVSRRIPFTLAMVAAILAVTAATGTMMRPISPALLNRWGFDLETLREGRLDHLPLTAFQVYRPYMVVTITTSLLFFVGACEYVLGTRRTFIAFWVGTNAG